MCHTVHRRSRSGTLIINDDDDVLINVHEMHNCDAKVCSSRRFVVISRRLTTFYSRGPSIIYDIRSASHRLFRVGQLKPSCYWSR